MRRHCRKRIFTLFFGCLIFYIGGYVFVSISEVTRDSTEKIVYLHALRRSSPMEHNIELCSSNDIDLIIIIISSSSHFLERESIRETWGSMPNLMNIRSQCIFVVGYQDGNSIFEELLNEAKSKHDLLYLTVDDDSMVGKELHAYKWLEKYCSNVTFTFKTNDYFFVNTFLLHELIQELTTNPQQYQNRYLYNNSLESLFTAHINPGANKFLFGRMFQASRPHRDKLSPFYVSYKEYPKDLYPPYCSIFGYLMDSKTRNLLTEEGLKDKSPFRFSDVYITGILPERLRFICNNIPFTYHLGSTDECINIIKKQNVESSRSPLIVCSTSLIPAYKFLDFYRIWTVLKHVYKNRMYSTQDVFLLYQNKNKETVLTLLRYLSTNI
ncbi:unnamed protein product [Rotaria socialis]